MKALETSAVSRIWASFRSISTLRRKEGVVDLAAELGVGGGEGLAEVGQPVEDGAGVVEVEPGSLAAVIVECCDRRFDVLVLGFEGADAIAHEHGVDACLDRGELALDALIEVRKLAGEALTLVAVSVLELADEVGMLGLEAGDAPGSKDVGREEAVDEVGDAVFADVLLFTVTQCVGGLVAVADAVAAGVVGVALAGLALHAQAVVAGGTANDSAEHIEAL